MENTETEIENNKLINTFSTYLFWAMLAYLIFDPISIASTLEYAYLVVMGSYGLAFVKKVIENGK